MTLHRGDRVTHRDVMAPGDSAVLPMKGTIVGIHTEYIVQWDNAEDRSELFGGGKETFTYSESVLVPLDAEVRA